MSEGFDAAALAFFAALPLQAPGSDEETAAVLAGLDLPASPAVGDFGCGTGRAALLLAERLNARVLAVDLVAPFVERLRAAAAERGLADRIDARVADMAAPPVEPGTLDLVWSEGAAYALGFESALARWHPLLRARGRCVVSECSWLTDDPPDGARAFWDAAYPSMGTVEANRGRATRAGYVVEATRVLPPSAWHAYYGPVERALEGEAGRALSPSFVEALRTEMAVYACWGDVYGYVFYVLRPGRDV